MSKGGRRSTSFQPGVSGNPGGRPKVLAEVRDLARQHTTTAVQALVDIMQDKKAPAAARVGAATALLDRGYGKPTQPIEASVNFLDRLTPEEQAAMLAMIEHIEAQRENEESTADEGDAVRLH